MPLYSYKCPRCQTLKDIARMLSEANQPIQCRECDEFMKKLPTSAGLKFKGRGWTPKHYPNK